MILLYDTPASRTRLYPLTLTKPVCDLRFGIRTLREFWESKSSNLVAAVTEEYLLAEIPFSETYTCVDASLLPNEECISLILELKTGEMLEDEIGMIAWAVNKPPAYNQVPVWLEKSILISTQQRLQHASNLFLGNASRIARDFQEITKDRNSARLHPSNMTIAPENIFIEEGATMYACMLNASEGPIYIGKNALVMEGTAIRGPVSIGEKAVVKMGAKLYPGTTIGPCCTAGGEIKNSILSGYSNKAHDGYLGDSVIGEWCNLGAGTTNSNVKNTGAEVAMWNQGSNKYVSVGNKAGMIMGDFSRTAINSSINTGTTIGISCNMFEGVFPLKHQPSFSWGNFGLYEIEKACRDAANWKKMKGLEFTEDDRRILQYLFEKRINHQE